MLTKKKRNKKFHNDSIFHLASSAYIRFSSRDNNGGWKDSHSDP